MKIMVTGGAGFIGSHLVERLVELGHEISVLDNLATGLRDNVGSTTKLIEADVRDAEAVKSALSRERPHVVCHLAAQMNVRRSLSDPADDADVNIRGGIHLFQAAAAMGVNRIVFASSGGAVYGEYGGRPGAETDLPQPASPYGIAKLAVEQYGRYFAEASGSRFISLRLANVYGPRQNPHGEAGIVSLFLHEMSQGRAPVIFGDGEQTRDFVWVGDVVEAFLRALTAPTGVYNVGTGVETSVNRIFQVLKPLAGFQSDPRYASAIHGELRRNALCITRAEEALGWVPRKDLLLGLRETAASVLRDPSLYPAECEP